MSNLASDEMDSLFPRLRLELVQTFGPVLRFSALLVAAFDKHD